MVKRLLGFVLLIGVVALFLQWMSLRETEPEPEKEVEVQVAVAPEEAPKEAPAPEFPIPPAAEQAPPTSPASAEDPPEPPASAATEPAPKESPAAVEPLAKPGPSPAAPADEQSPSELPATEHVDTSPVPEPPAPAAAEQEPATPPAAEETKPSSEPEPPSSPDAEPSPSAPPAAETSAPAESESPSTPTTEPAQSASAAAEGEESSSESEPLSPAAGEQAPAPSGAEAEKPPAAAESSVPPASRQPAAPSEPEPDTPEETTVEERVVPDEEFVAVEQAQGRNDERTDAQRRHQNQDGWYGWGVLADYADPDRAARLLGGAAAVQRDGSFFALRESSGGRVTARPIANISAAYGSIALRGHGSAFRQRLRRALSTGQLLGREADYKLWYLFPRREATHLGNKVVRVFECHVRESGLSGVAADRFREESKLRGAVLALRRANGGRLGIYLPRYFQTGEGRVAVAEACRALDEESRRFGS